MDEQVKHRDEASTRVVTRILLDENARSEFLRDRKGYLAKQEDVPEGSKADLLSVDDDHFHSAAAEMQPPSPTVGDAGAPKSSWQDTGMRSSGTPEIWMDS